MKYVSTRGKAPDLNFEEAMLTGLARDGGLYVPEIYPTLSSQQISSFSTKSYEEVAFEIMKPFVVIRFQMMNLKELLNLHMLVFHTKQSARWSSFQRTTSY